jgi:tetratricopeptide (TPR) repeat protein
MSTTEIQHWFREGVAAVKAGEVAQARQLLLQVVEADDKHEQGWLWLSGVMESDEERRICLENVLTINPDNVGAQRGLAKLDSVASGNSQTVGEDGRKRYTVRRERTPVSAASAVLYPEHQIQEWSWEEPEVGIQRKGFDTSIGNTSKFNDSWEKEEADLCAFCAHELDFEETTCSKCHRKLIQWDFRYAPSRHMYILFVLLINQAQLFFVQAVYDVIQQQTVIFANVFLPITFMLIFFVLAMGVVNRQFWAYALSIVALSLILLTVLASIISPLDLTRTGLPVNDPAIEGFLTSFGDWISTTIRGFQIATVVLALFYAILFTGPDFLRDKVRLTAVLAKGLSAASDYNSKARELSKKGQWAAAILHWQHAAGKEPHNTTYQRHLGLAYAQLGFYERSLDILQSAHDLTAVPQKQAQLKRMIQTVEKMQHERN